MPFLRELDLAKNKIVKLTGLQTVSTLRFLNLSLNLVEKILQLQYIELLPLLTELDFCYNPIQNKKHYRAQVLFHIPQLRTLDGAEIVPDEKIKAENLHGVDLKDREKIFKSLLPQEQFVDRRICVFDDIELESDDPESDEDGNPVARPRGIGAIMDETHHNSISHVSQSSNDMVARAYVGELLQKVETNIVDQKAE